jgi:type I restriction enzyme M protein
MLTAETKRRIDACRDILVGKLPLPTDQVELITLALIYKFMDDLDEDSVRLGGKRDFFTEKLIPYRWRALLLQTVPAEQRVALFSEGLEALGDPVRAAHLPGLFRDIFRNAFLKFRDGRILTLFLTEINAFAYTHGEELGNAFEYLLQCMGTQGENGQFRTPRHIIDFIVACLDPRPADTILDPACGTGGFLVSAYKHILARHTSENSPIPGDLLTHAQRKAVYQNLRGYDITDLMVKLSKVNLFLHGFPDPAVHIYDTLGNDARWHEKATLILANPPFMTPKGGVTPHARFRVPASKAEVLFTDYIAEHLAPDGRAGIIVPNGIVATTQNAYVKLRRYLVEDSLVAVASLPAGVFKPYSGVKTSILFLDKKLARVTDKILFLKITADGFDLGDKRTPAPEQNDLPAARSLLAAWFSQSGSGVPPLEQTVANGKLTWITVGKKEMLENANVTLSVERFAGMQKINSNYEIVPLHEVCEICSGGTPDRKESAFWKNGTIRWISSKHITESHGVQGGEYITAGAIENSATKLIPRHSLILITRVSVGKWAFLESPMAINQDLTAFIVKDSRLIPEYLKCVAPRLAKQIDASAVGIGVRGVTRDFVSNLEIPLPPLEEQKRIVAETEGYQKIVDAARQIITNYYPVLEMKPEWEMVRLGDVAEIAAGNPAPQSNQYFVDGKHPFFRTADVGRAKVSINLIETNDRLNELCLTEHRLRLFPKGTILFPKSGASAFLNHRALIGVDGYVSSHLACIIANESKVISVYLFWLLTTIDARTLSGNDSYPSIRLNQIADIQISLPPLDEQRRIVAELDAETAQIETVRALIPRCESKIQRVLDRVWGK